MMRVKRIGDHELSVPTRATAGAIGYDLSAAEGALIHPGRSAIIPTGFAWEIDPASDMPGGGTIPVLTGGIIRDRSSVAAAGLIVVGGIIDADYRGEVKVMLQNTGNEPVQIHKGEKIGQMLITSFLIWDLRETGADEVLTPTERGAGGFGSTGR